MILDALTYSILVIGLVLTVVIFRLTRSKKDL